MRNKKANELKRNVELINNVKQEKLEIFEEIVEQYAQHLDSEIEFRNKFHTWRNRLDILETEVIKLNKILREALD